MQHLCDWIKGRSISVSYIYILHLVLGQDSKLGTATNENIEFNRLFLK